MFRVGKHGRSIASSQTFKCVLPLKLSLPILTQCFFKIYPNPLLKIKVVGFLFQFKPNNCIHSLPPKKYATCSWFQIPHIWDINSNTI